MSPTKDRLQEMLQLQNGGKFKSERLEESSSKKINKTLEKAEVIQENIDIIKENTEKANDILKNNVFKITKGLQDQLDSLFQTNTTTAYKISNSLKELETDLSKISNATSAEYRIKRIQYTTLKQKFQEALRESGNCLEFHKNKRRELLAKSLKTTRQDINEEELETLLNENKLDVFTDNVLVTTEEARRQLLDIEERHKELLKIEKHLNEVLDLFIKLATLVEQQQESVDRVEYHAVTATNFVEQGTGVLEKSARSEKKYRKRKIYIILIVTVILLGFIAIIVVGL